MNRSGKKSSTMNEPTAEVSEPLIDTPVSGLCEHSRTPNQERLSSIDGCFWAVMVGSGETYLSAFAIALGGAAFHIGLLSALPQLGGAIGYLVGLRMSKWVQHRPSFMFRVALLQAGCWILLACIALRPPSTLTALNLTVTLTTLYFMLGSILSPAWNGLIGDSLDPNFRAHYFAKRNGFIALFTTISFVTGGLVLYYYQTLNDAMTGFIILFAVACGARLASAVYLKRHEEPGITPSLIEEFSLIQFLLRARQANFARFAIFSGCFHFAIGLGSPFIALYLLRDIGFGYFEYMILTASTLVVQYFTLRFWAQASADFGNRFVIRISSFVTGIWPLIFLAGQSFIWMLFCHLLAGIFWAAYTLGCLNFLFEAVSPERKARCSAYLNFLNSTGLLLGALLGSLLSASGMALTPTPGIGYFSEVGVLLMISSGMRILVSLTGPRLFTDIKKYKQPSGRRLVVRIRHARPFSATNFSLLTSLRKGMPRGEKRNKAKKDS